MPSVHLSARMEGSPSVQESYVSGVEHLLHAQEQQQQRQAKKLSNLSRKAEYDAEVQAAWQAKSAREERRQHQREAEREQERRSRAERSRRIEEHRRERMQSAERVEHEAREAARAKVLAVVNRAKQFHVERQVQHARNEQRAEQIAARRAAAMQQSQAIEAARRQQLERKQMLADELLRQKDELRDLEHQIKAEEEFLRDHRRTQVRSRSEAEHAAKVRFYATKTAEKEAAFRRKQNDMDEMRRLRAEEARQRAEYVALHAQQAAERDEAERMHMRARLEDKAARADAVAQQRRDLAEEMARMRQEMMVQESAVRSGLERLRASGAAFALPLDVARSLNTEQWRAQGIMRGAPGVHQHLVSMRTRSPERMPADRQFSPEGYDTPREHNVGGRHVRPASAPRYRTTNEFDYEGGTMGHISPPPAPERVRYTTAGPIAPSTARRAEEQLRQMLQDEIQSELQRQAVLSKVVDERERQRLTRIFSMERQNAKGRILDLSNAVGVGVNEVAVP